MTEIKRLECIQTLIEAHPEVEDRLSLLGKQKLRGLPRLQVEEMLDKSGIPNECIAR